MSREIRAPLNGIKGMTQVWVRQSMAQDIADSVGTMDRCANNLLSIIRDAQDLSQVGEHQFEIETHPFTISRMVEDVILLFQAKAQRKNIELVAQGDSEQCFGIGDEKRLTQVLSNLIGNAIKFSDQGQVELRWHWCTKATKDEPTEFRSRSATKALACPKSSSTACSPSFREYTKTSPCGAEEPDSGSPSPSLSWSPWVGRSV